MLFTSLASSLGAVEELAVGRSRRLLQISIATFVGLACAAAFAKGTTQLVLAGGLLGMLLCAGLTWRGYMQAGVAVLLGNMFILLSSLIWVSGGVRDLAMLGYPGLLVFAVILGNTYIFAGLFWPSSSTAHCWQCSRCMASSPWSCPR